MLLTSIALAGALTLSIETPSGTASLQFDDLRPCEQVEAVTLHRGLRTEVAATVTPLANGSLQIALELDQRWAERRGKKVWFMQPTFVTRPDQPATLELEGVDGRTAVQATPSGFDGACPAE